MKKIAFVSDSIYPYNKGGKETRIYEITTRLAKKGLDVHVYTMKWWKTDEKARRENGVTLHAISPFFSLYSGERRSILQGLLFGIACLRMISETFDVADVDHMPFFPLYSMKVVCLLKRKKMIATWHEVWGRSYWIKYMGIIGLISSAIEYVSFYLPDYILSTSEDTARKLSKYVSKSKIIISGNGANHEQINSIKPSKNSSDIIYAGRLLKHKNIETLIKAIKILVKKTPAIRCLIVGEGPEKEALKQIVTTLSIQKNIMFFDFFKNHNELYSLMKSSKVFVMPSSREGFGLVVIEAHSAGLPVVTVNEPENAAQFLVNANNGVVTNLAPESIADAISLLLKKKINKRQFQLENQKLYDWNRVVEKQRNIYNL